MERMIKEELKELEKLKDFKVYVFEWDVYVKAEDYKEIAIENKKLKKECEENDYLVEDNARWMKKCEEKIMEIKKLNIKVASLEWEIKWLNSTIEKLREENQTLESDGYKM